MLKVHKGQVIFLIPNQLLRQCMMCMHRLVWDKGPILTYVEQVADSVGEGANDEGFYTCWT